MLWNLRAPRAAQYPVMQIHGCHASTGFIPLSPLASHLSPTPFAIVATESIGGDAQKLQAWERNNPYDVYWSR